MAQREKERADEQLGRAEWLVYAGKLSLAQNAFAEGNVALALQSLDECQWNLRGWEHRYLWTKFNAKQTWVGGTQAFSPDGKRIVTWSRDQTVTGQELLTLQGHIGYITSMAFGPDGIVVRSAGVA